MNWISGFLQRAVESNDKKAQAEDERDKYCVSLHFFGDDLDPDEVSRLLGCSPTDSQRRGDLVQLRTRSYTAPSGSWRLSTKRSTDDIEMQLVALFERLNEDLQIWQSLTTRFDAELFCGVFLSRQGRGFDMSPRLHRLLADRTLHIVFDIYASNGPDEIA